MLRGKVAIVTGSTSGIGLGIAKELAKLGADLMLNGLGDASEIEAIRSGIEREHDVRAVYDGADMSKGEAVRGLIAATIEKFGHLDILVNNAGIQFTAPVEDFPAAKWNAILEINLSAAFAAIGATSLGVIFGALDATSLMLIAASAGLGALVRRWLSGFSTNPFIQPLCAAVIAGAVAATATSLHEPIATALVAFCPCMVLVPGPHFLNGAIDLVRTRIELGIARLTYAGIIVLFICSGLFLGFSAGGTAFPAGEPSAPVPFVTDVIAAGFAVASFGTFFSMPWRMLPFPIAAGMLGHAARWALVSLAGANVATGALVACILVSIIVTPVVDRLHLPFAALGFSAVVSMIPGFFLFEAASALVELVSMGPRAPVTLLTNIAANGGTAFLVILAMTFGLILPRMLVEHFLRPSV